MRLVGVGVLAACALGVAAQEFGGMTGVPAGAPRDRSYVTYAAEPATVAAGKRSVVEVHLRVVEGFHVNSHTPKSDLLIPTAAKLEPADASVTIGPVEYPKGVSYSFASNQGSGGGEVLDVYTGAVTLRVPVVAPAGEHALRGTLRYQACDRKACYPPRTLALEVPFTAK